MSYNSVVQDSIKMSTTMHSFKNKVSTFATFYNQKSKITSVCTVFFGKRSGYCSCIRAWVLLVYLYVVCLSIPMYCHDW